MSNFIYGRIVTTDKSIAVDSTLYYTMTNYCLLNEFGLHFIDTLPTKNTVKDLNFQLSDNSAVSYCEFFMEPIIYTLEGKPLTQKINNDISKIQGLICKIFEYPFIKKIELRFSYIEVDEEEYEVYQTSIYEMKKLIFEKFLSANGFPVMNIIITKNE